MAILTDYADTRPDLLGPVPNCLAFVAQELIIDVEPPANLNSLEDIHFVVDVVLTAGSQLALDQLRSDNMRTFKRFEDFEDHLRNL